RVALAGVVCRLTIFSDDHAMALRLQQLLEQDTGRAVVVDAENGVWQQSVSLVEARGVPRMPPLWSRGRSHASGSSPIGWHSGNENVFFARSLCGHYDPPERRPVCASSALSSQRRS